VSGDQCIVPVAVRIRELAALAEGEIDALSQILIDCVEGGASVSFMLPMTPGKAAAFWRAIGDDLAQRRLSVLVAEDAAGDIIGTVQVLLDQPENQPHRGAIAKMLVHRRARQRGVGAALLAAAEQLALARGKSVLVLDTAGGDAERLYRRHGWQFCGEIPDYALWPGGGLCATRIFYKLLRA
jgi:GNAT superfamily N-acetyltransferase